MSEVQEPKGIGFFNVKSGETHYARMEAQIQAYINSSDMGINASRGQDFGWRLDPEWVKKVKAFRKDSNRMSILMGNTGGQKPTTVQILYYIYGEQLSVYNEQVEEDSSPFEEQYQRDISSNPQSEPTVAAPAQLPSTDEPNDIPDVVEDADLEPADPEVKEPPQKVDESKEKSTKPKANDKKQ